jgi:hypothetical protein
MKLWRSTTSGTAPAAVLQANLASPLPDCIVLVCCTLVHVAWLAMRSPPPAIVFSRHPTKAIIITALFGAAKVPFSEYLSYWRHVRKDSSIRKARGSEQ